MCLSRGAASFMAFLFPLSSNIMKKSGSSTMRAPSPKNTAFSGISSYRTSTSVDFDQVARTHFDELSKYLVSYLAEGSVPLLSQFTSRLTFITLPSEPANSRSSSRQKLTRLTRQQFCELSTDVYDELIRRQTNSDNNQGPSFFSQQFPDSPSAPVPFLPVRDELHPKRNQARQKLATLPTSRFMDLSGDVYHELVRRYPEFKEEACLVFSLPFDSPFTPLVALRYSLSRLYPR